MPGVSARPRGGSVLRVGFQGGGQVGQGHAGQAHGAQSATLASATAWLAAEQQAVTTMTR